MAFFAFYYFVQFVREVNLEETPVSKVMTRNPVFVLSDTRAVEALQKMVQGWYYTEIGTC